MTLFDSEQDEGSVRRGFLLGGGANLLFIAVGLGAGINLADSDHDIAHVIGVLLNYAVGAISVLQLAYLYPMYQRFVKAGAKETAKGLMIAAAVTALLSCTCWAIFIANFNKL